MDKRISDQSAFILQRRDYQNSSLILELFTEDYGRISVLAKGARKRKDVGHFQLGYRLAVGWQGQAELKTLTQIDSYAIMLSPRHYLALFYVNELLLYLLPKQDEHPQLFQHYQLLLLGLAQQELTQEELESSLRNFEMDLLSELGLFPDLEHISTTGQEVLSNEYYLVDSSSGVVKVSNNSNQSFSGQELMANAQRQFEIPEHLFSAKKLLRKIIDFNLQGRQLQSRKLYQQLNLTKL